MAWWGNWICAGGMRWRGGRTCEGSGVVGLAQVAVFGTCAGGNVGPRDLCGGAVGLVWVAWWGSRQQVGRVNDLLLLSKCAVSQAAAKSSVATAVGIWPQFEVR